MRGVWLLPGLAAAALTPSAVHAQERIIPRNVFDGDYAVVGVGVGSMPTYQGSDNSSITPLAGATGQFHGVGFTIRGPSLSLDFIPDRESRDVNFHLGPQIAYVSNRHGHIGDEVVARLGKLKPTVEAGLRVGMTIPHVVSPHDRISVGVGAQWDITGNSKSMVISPSMSYLVPVSTGLGFGALVSAQFVNGNSARYNFDVTPEGSAASGLPVYNAKGGLQQVTFGVAAARDLNNNFLDGGFSIAAGVLYTRLYGSAAKSPITAIRGSRNQWYFGGGLAYTF